MDESPTSTPRAANMQDDSAADLGGTSASRASLLNSGRFTESGRPTDAYRPSGRTSVIFDIVAVPEDDLSAPIAARQSSDESAAAIAAARKKKYGGRYRMWPGILLLVVICFGSAFLMGYFAHEIYQEVSKESEEIMKERKEIEGGSDVDLGPEDDLDVAGNPTVYPDRKCQQLDYISKNNMFYGVTKSGKEIKLPIKGINWSGMETSFGIPYGLWDNPRNGTTIYQIAAFLAKNNFNAIRLPLSVENILENIKPNQRVINKNTNQAINTTNYRTTLSTVVQALAYRGIGVLLDIHTLTPRETGELWYNNEISEDDLLEAIHIMADDMCNSLHWNILGVDLKNEPSAAVWGSGVLSRDWRLAAERIGNKVLKECKYWTAHVEGVTNVNEIELLGKSFSYYDWWGGGLQNAGKFPVRLDTPHKVVFSPHYYTPSVYPARYFFEGGKDKGATYQDYIERSDADLSFVVEETMMQMFGYLAKSADYAIIPGEFGGIYSSDKHPKKTVKRIIDNIIRVASDQGMGYAGGFVWCMNPESGYEFNPSDVEGKWHYGLLHDDWLTVNEDYLDALSAFDRMDGLKQFPCIQEDDTVKEMDVKA